MVREPDSVATPAPLYFNGISRLDNPPKINPISASPMLLMEQGTEHFEAMAHLLEICVLYARLQDASGYYVACEKLLNHARELAKIQRDLRLSFNARNK